MSDPLTPDDLERMRAKAEATLGLLLPHPLNDQKRELAEMVVCLLDEVERLRRSQSERDQMARLQTEWEQHVIAGQSEAPSVSEGGRD